MAQLDKDAILAYFKSQYPGSFLSNGLPTVQASTALDSLINQINADPTNAQKYIGQAGAIIPGGFQDYLTQQVSSSLGSTPVTVQNGGSAPTITTLGNQLNPPSTTPPPTSPSNPPSTGVSAPVSQPVPTINPLPSGPDNVNPYGGLENPAQVTYGSPKLDINNILSEAELQKSLQSQTLQGQYTANQKYLQDLSGLLQQQQAQQLTQALPGVYEDLNTRGLLRSSALGNSLATEQGNLARQTSNALAQQGLAYQGQYTQGLGNIESNYLNMRNQALQRGFSLSDYGNQIAASKELGFALQPQQPSTGKSDTNASVTAAGTLLTGLAPLAKPGK